MTDWSRIDVAMGARSYPVLIAPAFMSRLGSTLDGLGCGPRRFVVSNPTVWRFWGQQATESLPGATSILVPDGERFKTLATVSRIYDELIRAEADRASVVIALGGGVVGDMAGHAAATFLRGVAFVQVPTTLLAQVDAAVGGKVGVNYGDGKNMVGAFHQPLAVLIDPSVLATLPRREFRSGLYEIIKYGMACDGDLFARIRTDLGSLFRRETGALTPIIADSCRIKAAIVASDEREAGPRRVLNFGHTIGHALESLTRYHRFLHGEAVGFGMLVAADLAVRRGFLPSDDAKALASLIGELGPLPPIGDLSAHETVEHVRRDKKILDGRLHLVLPTGIGHARVVSDVSEAELVESLLDAGLVA
jgi:3-dehydroquinate synthase